jgi:CheY-like chemotaxis protein
VLCIEDNVSSVKLLERVLEQRPNVRMLAATQGSLGLDLARLHHPDLILLDLNLPDMHGRDVLDQLRHDPETANIPVVVLSADATPGQIARLMDAGANDYLTKPINVAKTLEVLDEVLEHHAA